MTRHGPLGNMTAITTRRSMGSLVPGPGDVAPITQCSTVIVCMGPSFVSKTPGYATLRSRSRAARSTTKTNQNPLSP
jgi:hypothetical protein